MSEKEFPDNEPSPGLQNEFENTPCGNTRDEFVYLLYSEMVTLLQKRNNLGCEIPDLESSLSDDNVKVKVEFQNRNGYEGRLSNGRMEGEGIYRWGSGETFKGRFKQNSIEGNGHLEWKDQSWYEGEFRKGYRHGTGNLVSHGYGRFYIGEWYMGRKHGNGYCRYNGDEDYYDGTWDMDLRHGAGYRVYSNGARYVGQWEDDRRHGVGTMVWPNGDVYRGDWKNGVPNGYGEYVWNGLFNESLSWPRENCYTGEWLNGTKHGKGTLKLNSVGGAKYVGEWQTDEKHGYGMIIGNSGAVTEANPLFVKNILTPLDTDAIPESGEPDISASKIPATKHKKPRKTTVFEPLQFPSLWFHVRRLFQPKYRRLRCSVAPVIPSGKCFVCKDDSACFCLHDSSKGSLAGSRSAMETSSSSTSMSSGFCTHPLGDKGIGVITTKEQYEEHWVHNCLTRHMSELRKIYKRYAELYHDSEETEILCSDGLSMSKISLWQLMRDCEIHTKGVSLVELERRLALNGSAFVETTFYPFERIEFFQLIHTLLEISWQLYTRLDDVETEAVRGRLAGGLHRLLVNDIFPKAGKHVGNVKKYRDILPIYSVYQLYCDVGEPHTARQLLRASCVARGADDPEPLPLSGGENSASYPMNGRNAITVGEKLSYIPSAKPSLNLGPANQPEWKYEDKLACELFALRHIGAPKMVSVMTKICPAIKDEETGTIVDMDYELTFLEFYEILLEATMELIHARKVSELESETREAETNADSLAEKLEG